MVSIRTVSFRFKLLATFGLLLALIAAPLAVVWFAADRSAHYDERARLAHWALSAHLRLAERGQRLLRHLQSRNARPGDAEERRLRGEVATEFNRTRAAITAEVALIGPEGEPEERVELARLDEIRNRLERAARGEPYTWWRRLVIAAVADEQREVAQIDAANQRLTRAVQITLLGAAGAALLIGGLGLYWLQRSIRRPLQALTAGTRALAAGNLGHRIGLDGEDEFAALGRSFDGMAAELERQALTIARSHEALEDIVAERTGDLAAANAQLAEAADRRRRFLADVSHELRTPLTIIRGEAEVTLRGADRPATDYRAALTRVVEQARGMARLVDDLLFVARNDAGQQRLTLGAVALAPLLDAAVADLRSVVEADGGQIAFTPATDNAIVTADPDRLRQLVHILLDNAIRYSSAAPEISVAMLPSPGGVTVRIADRGIGIGPDELPFAFDRFRRGVRAIERGDEGSGLGLPLAKAIVEAHGGSIHLDSAEDVGTTVSVFLPTHGRLRAVA